MKEKKQIKGTLIIDTREQLPLPFGKSKYWDIIKEKIDFGDYGLKINDKLVCAFERKSASDLFGTLTSGHERFNKEIQRAKEKGIFFFIIIENTYDDIMNKRFDGSFKIKTKGHTIIKTVHTMTIKHDLNFIFCNGRTEMKDYIYNMFYSLINFYDKHGGKEKNEQ